jgi:hypothetical protein
MNHKGCMLPVLDISLQVFHPDSPGARATYNLGSVASTAFAP